MTQLEILSLTLKDYRQYKGEVEIDLQTNNGNNINVIEGQNGAGKSNILNAITLCLYGRESHLENNDENGLETYPHVNRKRLSEIEVNETAEGYVEVTLGGDSPEYIFKRGFQTVKLPGGEFSSTSGDLQLKQKMVRDWKSIEQPITRLNQILPVHVHEYFLFDGERLDDFFGKGYQERVRKGLLDVSHIELLTNAIDHLNKTRKNIRNKIDDEGGEAEQKGKALARAEKELEELKNELSETKRDIEDTENLIENISTTLRDSSNEEVREKQARYDHLEEELEKVRKEIEELRSEAGKSIVESGTPLYAIEELRDTKERLNELSEKGELPPKIQDQFIQQLIDRGICICGEEITAENTEHLQSLKQDMSNVDEDNIDGIYEIPHIIEDGLNEADKLVRIRKQILEAEDKEDRINKEWKEVSEELESYDIPDDIDVAELENQRQEYRVQVSDLNEKKGKLKSDIETKEEDIREKEEEYENSVSKKNKNAELLEKANFALETREKLKSIKSDILSSIRADIENKMNSYFNEIIWKDEKYTIKLGEDYQVRVEGPRNNNKIGSLSAGESQVLALSFLAAITQISGFSAPIIIDTPLGRISSTPKRRIARNLPKYIDDSQITFLMTDEEYTGDVRTNLKSSITHEYRLEFADEVTRVKSYE